ncbi:hypothetical protein LINGRAHAP2_LOCUS27807, partial [Linum grandiflorum]
MSQDSNSESSDDLAISFPLEDESTALERLASKDPHLSQLDDKE